MNQGPTCKLTPELRAKLMALLRAGNYVETAAACCGISKQTLYNWLREGARLAASPEDLKALRGKARQAGQEMIALNRSVDEALAQAEARDLLTIDKAAQGYDVEVVKEKWENGVLVERKVERTRKFDWAAAAWRLERKFQTRWGRKERLEHSGPEGGPIRTEGVVNLAGLTPEELRQMAALLRKGNGAEHADDEEAEDRPGDAGETALGDDSRDA